MSVDQKAARENIIMGMKKSGAEQKFRRRYGDKWQSVMYATATKKAMS